MGEKWDALDFIISVLREHEGSQHRFLTELKARIRDLNAAVQELQSYLTYLTQRVPPVSRAPSVPEEEEPPQTANEGAEERAFPVEGSYDDPLMRWARARARERMIEILRELNG